MRQIVLRIQRKFNSLIQTPKPPIDFINPPHLAVFCYLRVENERIDYLQEVITPVQLRYSIIQLYLARDNVSKKDY